MHLLHCPSPVDHCAITACHVAYIFGALHLHAFIMVTLLLQCHLTFELKCWLAALVIMPNLVCVCRHDDCLKGRGSVEWDPGVGLQLYILGKLLWPKPWECSYWSVQWSLWGQRLELLRLSEANVTEEAAIEAGYVVLKKASEAKATGAAAAAAAAVDTAIALEESAITAETV